MADDAKRIVLRRGEMAIALAQYWRPVSSNKGLGSVMAAESRGLCISSSPSSRSPRSGGEQRNVCLRKGSANTSGCRLPEEACSRERKGVAINRDASYRNA